MVSGWVRYFRAEPILMLGSAYHPFFRAHAHLDSKRREPFLFEEIYKSAMRTAILQRYLLLPYW